MTSRQLAGYHVIRLAVASVFLVHALARIGLDIIFDSLPIPPPAQGHRESVAQLTARSFAAAHMML